ncbi:hypothetical protein ONE63_006477 [Megalurothrips usitatus]|uniref:Uncharacterized protein n=1 Tax=Megalurothrips usitatus TaxID=439358 RepID=A0AAV7XU50_9NEOP|nr:hypothetical protein ONE63_006477 [Megalurothrips usitatus]
MFWLARTIPGPPNGALCFAGPMDEVLDKAIAAQRKYGNVVRVWAWPAVNITICEPDDLEVLCTSPHLQHKPAIVYDSMSPIMGEGLVSLSGDVHRRHRKAIGPSLHLDILQDFLPTFERNALQLCKQFEQRAATGEPFNATDALSSYSAHAICETVFSSEFAPRMQETKAHFIRYLHASSALMYYRVMRPWLFPDALFYFTRPYAEYQEAARVFQSFVTMMLDYKVDQLKKGAPQRDRKRRAFLDHVLTSTDAQVLSHRELVEELKTVSGAAIGTSTDLMSVFLLVVSLLPDVQEKIAKELDDVFGGTDRPVEPADLGHLQYLECVLKESMRLFPPVFSFSRTVLRDVTLPSGHVLPEGAIVAAVPHFTHRDPRHWTDPDKFDPDRFLPENSRGRHPFAFVPFSAGSRNCIGQRYAMMSAKVLASSILRRFRVLPSGVAGAPSALQDIKMLAGISSAPLGGAVVRVERRAKSEQKRRG